MTKQTKQSRRSSAAVASTANLTPNVAGALQGEDPIFALIEAHKAAFKEFTEASLANDEVAAKLRGEKLGKEASDRYDVASEAELALCEALIATQPETLAGIAAAIKWLAEYDDGCLPDMSGRFLRTLAASPLLIGA